MIWTIFEHSFLVTCGILYGIWAGKKSGREMEKQRCSAICRSVLYEGNLSPTLRRVYHAIETGRESPITEEEFFEGKP